MATNQRGTAGRVHVTAPATLPSGSLVYANGFHGVQVNDAVSGAADTVIDTRAGISYDIPNTGISSPAKGDVVYIALDGHTLSKTATAHRPVGIIEAVPGGDAGRVIPAGYVRLQLLPQNTTVPTA